MSGGDRMLDREQRLAMLRIQVTGWSAAELVEQINFARDEIKATPSDKHRAQMQDNLSIYAYEIERRQERRS